MTPIGVFRRRRVKCRSINGISEGNLLVGETGVEGEK